MNERNGGKDKAMSNIAEGLERGSKTEFIQFLFTSKGPKGEKFSRPQRIAVQARQDTITALRAAQEANIKKGAP
jgi:hypothetical protein